MENKENIDDNIEQRMLGKKAKSDTEVIYLEDPESDKKIKEKTQKLFTTYKIEDEELKKVQINTKVYFRILLTPEGKMVDIRKYYKGYPTKQGVRFTLKLFKKLIEVIKDEF